MITTHKTANLYTGNCMRKRYSRITSTKSSSFYITTFSTSLTNLKVFPSQSRDCSFYV